MTKPETSIQFRAELQPKPKKWERNEIMFLLKYYPMYKSGNLRYNAGVIRGHLQNRTMAAISKKYWEIMGSDRKPRTNVNQFRFDFDQEKITDAKL